MFAAGLVATGRCMANIKPLVAFVKSLGESAVSPLISTLSPALRPVITSVNGASDSASTIMVSWLAGLLLAWMVFIPPPGSITTSPEVVLLSVIVSFPVPLLMNDGSSVMINRFSGVILTNSTGMLLLCRAGISASPWLYGTPGLGVDKPGMGWAVILLVTVNIDHHSILLLAGRSTDFPQKQSAADCNLSQTLLQVDKCVGFWFS